MNSAYYQPNVVALPPNPPATGAMLGSNQGTVIVSHARQQGRAAQRATGGASNAASEEQQVGKYRIVRTIGRGNFARVKLARHVLTGKDVAIKIIDKAQFNAASLQKIYREVRVMRQIEHPNIVKLYEVIDGGRYLYLIIEYLPNGEMFDYIARNGKLKENVARARFRQVVSAVQYLHAHRIVHRDLKAENLLLDADLNVKLCDFGFANEFRPDRKLDTFCGSPPYAAPELYQGQKYVGPEVDVWSMGVILYVFISGTLPFEGATLQVLRDKIVRGKFRVPFWMSGDCETLVRRCLTVNPSRRWNVEQIMLNDRWLNIEGETMKPATQDSGPDQHVDPAVVQAMARIGFAIPAVLESATQRKYDHTFATYLILKTTARHPGALAAIGVNQPVSTNVVAASPSQISHPLPLGHPAANYAPAAATTATTPTPTPAPAPAAKARAPLPQPYSTQVSASSRKVSESLSSTSNMDDSRGVLNISQLVAAQASSRQEVSAPQSTSKLALKANAVQTQKSETQSKSNLPDSVDATFETSAAEHQHQEKLPDAAATSTSTEPPILPPRDFRNRQQVQQSSARRSKQQQNRESNPNSNAAKKKKSANSAQAPLNKAPMPPPASAAGEELEAKPARTAKQTRRRETSVDNLNLVEEMDSVPSWFTKSHKNERATPVANSSSGRRMHDSFKRAAGAIEIANLNENVFDKENDNDHDHDHDHEHEHEHETDLASLGKSKSSLKSDSAMFEDYATSLMHSRLPEAISMNNFTNQNDSVTFRGRKEQPQSAAAASRRSTKSSQANADSKRVSTKAGYENLNEAVAAESRPQSKIKPETGNEAQKQDEKDRYVMRDKYSSMKKARLLAMDNEEMSPTPTLTQFAGNFDDASPEDQGDEEERDQCQLERDSMIQQAENSRSNFSQDEDEMLPRSIYDRQPSKTSYRRSYHRDTSESDSAEESALHLVSTSDASKHEVQKAESSEDESDEEEEDDAADQVDQDAVLETTEKPASAVGSGTTPTETNSNEPKPKSNDAQHDAVASDLFLPDLALLAQHTVGNVQLRRTSKTVAPNSSRDSETPSFTETDAAARQSRRSSAAPNPYPNYSQLHPSVSQPQFAAQPTVPYGVSYNQQVASKGVLQVPDASYPARTNQAEWTDDRGRKYSRNLEKNDKGGGFIDRFARLFRRAPPPSKLAAANKGTPHHRSIATVTASEAAYAPSRTGVNAGPAALMKPKLSVAAQFRYGQSDPFMHLRGKQPRVVRGAAKVSKTSTQSAERLLIELMNVLEEEGCSCQFSATEVSSASDILPFELVCTYQDAHSGPVECRWLMEVVELANQKMNAVRCRRLDGDEIRYRGLITRVLNQLS